MIEVVTVEEFTTVIKQTKLVINGYTDTIIILILVFWHSNKLLAS